MYAIMFDFDTGLLEQLYSNGEWRNAYSDVKTHLSAHGFEQRQGDLYLGDPATVDAVKCVIVVQTLATKYPWFAPSLRDIRMLRIEDNSNLMPALKLATQMKGRRELAHG
jgi:virulence-associated protein VapD